MSTISEPKRCPKCGGPIPVEAPQGLCPTCLLQQACVPTEAGRKGESAKSPPPKHEELAAAFPQLEILELIGQGGMGFVFKARQPKIERLVALKILPSSLAADPAFAERFTREGRMLARLNHPNIVTLHDFGQAGGFFYLLMEFVDGVNLRQAMKVGRFTPAQALAIVPKICEALQFAHNEGILHRDIKPENILLDTKGRVKIADFGIAKLVGGEDSTPGKPGSAESAIPANLTETGKILGTPQYMAPEQIEHPQDVDQRADIYSLGVVFYEMLTGELPLGRFAPPSEKSTADPRVDEVVLRTLEKERERRYQQASEVKTDVETIASPAAAPVELSGSRPTEVTQAIRPRHTGLPWALIIVAALFIASGCWAAWQIAHDAPRHIYNFNLGVLALPIGIGLLRRRPWWRNTALSLLWFSCALIIVVAGLALTGHMLPPITVKWLGREVTGPARIWAGLLGCTLGVALLVWMYRVLVRPEVKALFHRGPFARPWIEWGALAAALLLASTISWLLLATGVDRINSVFTASSFGPVVERLVRVDRTENAFLDLATGDYVTAPEDIDPAKWRSQELVGWLAGGQNADVMPTVESGQTRLALCYASSRPVPNRAWDKPWLLDQMQVEVLTNPPSAMQGPVEVLLREDVPATVAFHTQHHGAGLLQTLGFTENPRGVKIRYKLVRGAPMPPTAPAELPGQLPPAGGSSASVPSLAPPAVEGKFIMDTYRSGRAQDEPGELVWKCFVPPGSLASILFVRWTNGVPQVVPGFSAYLKVGGGGIDLPFCMLLCHRLVESKGWREMNEDQRHQALARMGYPESAGVTNAFYWSMNLGSGWVDGCWTNMPPYHWLKLPLPQSVRSGHQRAIRLIDFDTPEGKGSQGQSGVELRIFLEPLKSPPIRMVPNEVDHTNYISGTGLGGTMEDALRAIREWPTDP